MRATTTAFLLALACAPSLSHAEKQSINDLTECLAKATGQADQATITRWMFTTLAAHPDLKDLASISEKEQAAIEEQASNLFRRYIQEDCAHEYSKTIHLAGQDTVATSFEENGRIVTRELLQHPSVIQAALRVNSQFSTHASNLRSYPDRKRDLEEKLLDSPTFPARPIWWEHDSILAVGIVPSTRKVADSAAKEACALLQQHNFKSMQVQVFDVVAIQKHDNWHLMSLMQCRN